MKHLIPTLIVASTMIAAPVALAEPTEEVNMIFKYKASELTSDEGVNELLSRLERRAERTCLGNERRTAAIHAELQSCVSSLMDDAVAKISSDNVVAAYEKKITLG